MTETCEVKKIKNGLAYVEITRKPQCGSCKACAFNDDGKIILPAIMDVDCSEGDTVIIEMPQKQYNFSAIILFLFPLILFLVGILVGRLAGDEIFMILFGFLFAALGLFIAFIIDRSFRKNRDYAPVVVERIYKEFCNEGEHKNND